MAPKDTILAKLGRTGAPPVPPGASPGEFEGVVGKENVGSSCVLFQRVGRPLGQAGRLSYPASSQAGFTMVEIALSIAVVAFALVAILGVLPTGMTVQKDNRDDGVINQEGRYWLEAIRSGARGLDDITNYVESITVTNLTNSKKSVTFDNGYTSGVGLRPQDVIALLSTPKFLLNGSDIETNRVTARVKAITGPAAEKGPLTNEFSFRYEMQVEITPVSTSLLAGTFPDADAQRRYIHTLGDNLHELRLIMRWPVVQRGNGWFVGNNRKTFRARIAGSFLVETNATPSIANTFRTAMKTNLVVLSPNKFNVDATRTQ